MTERAAAIVPARYASVRLPGKLLLDETGKPLLQHVWERVRRARRLDPLLVATDDERIAAAARGFGAEVVMTRDDHVSGTDRVAEVARGLEAERVLLVQGDEPEIDPDDLDRLVERLGEGEEQVVTLARPFGAHETELFAQPDNVKVVLDGRGRALYFSRSPIPYGENPRGAHLHLGVYGFRRDALLRLASLPPAPLERRERLEQLRALCDGMRIGVVLTSNEAVGIDTRVDYDRFVARVRGSDADPVTRRVPS